MKIKANSAVLSRVTDLIYVHGNAYAPLVKAMKKDLQFAMDTYADDVVEITFKVHPNFLEADLKMYGSRFDGVSGWEITPVETIRHSSLETKEEIETSILRRYFAIRKPGTPSRDNLKSAAKIQNLEKQLRKLEDSSGTGHNVAKMNKVRTEIEKLEGVL